MVKLYKNAQDGGDPSTVQGTCTIFGCGAFKGYRRKRLVRVKALKMLTPTRGGPVGSAEITDDTEQKDPSADVTMTGKSDGDAVTPGSQNGDEAQEFLSTGRTGRRNALPHIMGRHAKTGISDLPDRFEELTTTMGASNVHATDLNMPSTSKQHTG